MLKMGLLLEKLLSRYKLLARLLELNPAIRSRVNATLINSAVRRVPPRPYPLSTLCDYTSWDSLTDRTYSGRHLAPAPDAEVAKLPDVSKVIELFKRPESRMRPCKKSTVLFSYFAQWFTDAFLRTARERLPAYAPTLRNTSSHDIDLCNLYGLRWNVFGDPKNDVEHLRSRRGKTQEPGDQR